MAEIIEIIAEPGQENILSQPPKMGDNISKSTKGHFLCSL